MNCTKKQAVDGQTYLLLAKAIFIFLANATRSALNRTASRRLRRWQINIILSLPLIYVGWILSANALLYAKEYADTIENFKIIKVRDGDTFVITIEDTIDVFGKEIAVRIRGIDTPAPKAGSRR